MAWVLAGFVNYKKGCTRLAAASDKVYQLLAHGQWFSPGIPVFSTTKTGRHDIAESGVKTPKIKKLKIIVKKFECQKHDIEIIVHLKTKYLNYSLNRDYLNIVFHKII